MLPCFIRARPQLALQVILYFPSVAGMNQPERIQASAFRVWTRVRSAFTLIRREVRSEDGHALCERSLVNHSKCSGGTEHGPVGCSTEPFEIVSKELVGSCTRVGKGVGKGDSRMEDGCSRFQCVLNHQQRCQPSQLSCDTTGRTLMFLSKSKSE